MKANLRLLKGRQIVHFYPGKRETPVFILDNGAVLTFVVRETGGEYAIDCNYTPSKAAHRTDSTLRNFTGDTIYRLCDYCQGVGYISSRKCNVCHGNGKVRVNPA